MPGKGLGIQAGLLAALALGVLQEANAQTRPEPRRQPAAEQVQRPLSFAPAMNEALGVLVLPLGSSADLEARGGMLTAEERASVERAIQSARFAFEARQMLALRGIGRFDQILVAGAGPELSPANAQRLGAAIGRRLLEEPGAVTVSALGFDAVAVAQIATGLGLGEYRSDLFVTRDRMTAPLAAGVILADDPGSAEAAYRGRGRAIVDAMAWARDLSNAPGNVIYPETFVAAAREAFRGLRGVRLTVLDEQDMARLGMGALLGVGRGSARPPRLLAIHYRSPDAPEGAPLVFAGKGITFDSGGVSIKPASNMHNMRMDMSGAASVTGAVLALARAGAPVNVVAVAALAENMPDGGATRPGDVLTAFNGMTIEVQNTDAEGRLVLADAVAWAEAELAPAAIVDVATLTGAVRGALGDDFAGLFSRHDWLAEGLRAAGEAVGEPVFQLPLHPSYASDLSSTLADIRNVSGEGTPGAGTGAWFIGAFLAPETPWAHLDIANMAWSGANDWKPDGSAGFAVRLLERFARDFAVPAPTP